MRVLPSLRRVGTFLWIGVALLTAIGLMRTVSAQAPPRLSRDAVLNHLNAAITWYRDSTNKVHAVGLPSDAIYQDNARNLAAEAVRLAFQSARAAAALIDAGSKDQSPSESSKQSQQDFHQMAANTSAQIDDTQAKLDSISKQLRTAPRRKRQALLAQRDKLQGALTLDKAVLEAVQKMANFAGPTGDFPGEGLEGSINQLAHSVPEIFGNRTDGAQNPATHTLKVNPAPTACANSSGLVCQSIMLIGRVRSMHDIDQMVKETDRLRQTTEALRKPLRDTITATVQRGRDLANQAEAASNESPQDVRHEYQDLTDRFKQLSNATLPLSQEL